MKKLIVGLYFLECISDLPHSEITVKVYMNTGGEFEYEFISSHQPIGEKIQFVNQKDARDSSGNMNLSDLELDKKLPFYSDDMAQLIESSGDDVDYPKTTIMEALNSGNYRVVDHMFMSSNYDYMCMLLEIARKESKDYFER